MATLWPVTMCVASFTGVREWGREGEVGEVGEVGTLGAVKGRVSNGWLKFRL